MNNPKHPATDTAEALRQDREEAKQELAGVASELADKLDVQTRTKNKMHETEEAAKAKAAQAKHKVEDAAAQIRLQAHDLSEKGRQVTPDPVLAGGRRVVELTRNQPVPVAAAVLFTLLLWLILRRRSGGSEC